MSEPIIKNLQDTLPQIGRVAWVGVRPASRQPLVAVDHVLASRENALEGDRFNSQKSKKRQVTLIQAEHIDTVSSIMGNVVDPGTLRRNIVVSGINLLALKDRKFKIGEAILEYTGLCHPCSRMETNLGPGGWNAMRGHGGITAQVIEDGVITLDDSVSVILSS
ncbi:MAG: MOSC domain-containing protein [Bacteroidota bacterium]